MCTFSPTSRPDDAPQAPVDARQARRRERGAHPGEARRRATEAAEATGGIVSREPPAGRWAVRGWSQRGFLRVRKRAAVAGVVVAGVVVAGGVAVARSIASQPPAVTYLTATAAVTDVVDTVSVTGSVQPVETYALAFGQAPVRNPKPSAAGGASAVAQPWTVATVNVQAGDNVASGMVLATADTSDAQAALDTAQLNLDAAKARLKADSAPVAKTTKAKAKLAITQANKQLSQAKTAQSQTAASGRLAVSQANAVLSDARKQLADDKSAGLPDTVISADEAAVKQAERGLATTKQQTATANTQAAAAVETAKLNVQSAQLAYDSTTTVNNDALVAADKVAVSQAETAVSDAQTTLDRLTLVAPIDGTVSSVAIQPGDVVSGTVIVIRSRAVEVSASVTEADLPVIKVGEAASVSITAIDATAKGTVSEIDLAGATKSASGVVSYAVTIALPQAPPRVAPSMTADVDITTATADSVVAVPASAIGGTPGDYSVQVLDGPGEVHTVSVDVGLMTATLAEIRSGLNAGTVVVTGVATAKDLVTTFPTGGGGATRTPAPSGP
jgi:multidrug efflux pump subunit AcrA (membrane-fusion protein)